VSPHIPRSSPGSKRHSYGVQASADVARCHISAVFLPYPQYFRACFKHLAAFACSAFRTLGRSRARASVVGWRQRSALIRRRRHAFEKGGFFHGDEAIRFRLVDIVAASSLEPVHTEKKKEVFFFTCKCIIN